MRFNRLDILRYGALTDRSLAFRPGAGLHIIYGPNEAGKSSALRAISDLLFGFPTAAENSFLHDPAALRIGAEIISRDGQTLSFRRRRGRKNTLLSASEPEEALAEDSLAPFIGNLGRDVFERAFGLDSARLRAGADAMLKSGGEIGSLLFSAASGLTGLATLKRQLETEADSIYAPRRSKDRLFYQVLDQHDDARRIERESELKSGDWKRLVSDAAEVQAQLASLQGERQETKKALERLRTLAKLEPLVREIDAELTLLHEFDDLESLPQGFDIQLAEALDRYRDTQDACAAAEAEKLRIQDELNATHVDAAILDAAPAIMELYAGKGSYLKAREDILRVQAEVDDYDQEISRIAFRLGLGGDAESLGKHQPADADLLRLRRLAEQGRDLQRAYDALSGQLEDERKQLRRVEAAGKETRLIDPKPYQEQMAALQDEIALVGRLDALQVRAKRARFDFEEFVSRLSPPVADLEQLLRTPLPDMAVLADHRRKLEAAQADVARNADRVSALQDGKAAIERDLAALSGHETLVTRDEILAARRHRDELWARFSDSPAPSTALDIARAMHQADRLSDIALENAEAVSRYAQLREKLAEQERELAAAEAAAEDSLARQFEVRAAFQALFDAVGIVAESPDRMVEWRRAVEDLERQRAALHELEDELSLPALAEQRLRPALTMLAEATGLEGAQVLPVTALARALSRHIAGIAERWNDNRSTEGKRLSILEAIAELEDREISLSSDISRWKGEFRDAAEAIGLSGAATIEMVETVLDIWKELPRTLAEKENRLKRVRGMSRDIATYEDAVRTLALPLRPQLASLSPDAVTDMLHAVATEARSAEQVRRKLLEAMERIDIVLARRMTERNEANAAVAGLLETVSVPDEPVLLAGRLKQRRDLEARLSASRRRFQEQAAGRSEEDIRAELAEYDRVAAGLDIEQLEAEDNGQVERFAALTARLAENDRQRRALESGTGAEKAVFMKLAAEDGARDLARQWVVLKLASSLLSSSMEAYREKQADPVMRRAGDIFSQLTGGRFSRLVQNYDEKDELRLLAERAGGGQVPLDGLSEGTGDQLYLALRLAFLEDYSSRNEPVPLILDDVFQTFDDERTAAGLKTLAQTGAVFQTVLFTHQTSVVEIARREIGAGLDVVNL